MQISSKTGTDNHSLTGKENISDGALSCFDIGEVFFEISDQSDYSKSQPLWLAHKNIPIFSTEHLKTSQRG